MTRNSISAVDKNPKFEFALILIGSERDGKVRSGYFIVNEKKK